MGEKPPLGNLILGGLCNVCQGTRGDSSRRVLRQRPPLSQDEEGSRAQEEESGRPGHSRRVPVEPQSSGHGFFKAHFRQG